jgi:hypothetical protein
MTKWILRVGAVVLVGIVVATAVLVGCSGGSTPTSAKAPASSSSAPMMSSSPAKAKAKATAPGSMMPSSSMPAGSMMPSSSSMAPSSGMMTPQCDSSNTSVTLGMSNGAAGTDYQTLVIKNTSMSDCVTGGYPGISLDNSMDAQLGPAAGRMGGSGSQVTLAPGHEATDIFSYGDAAVSTEMGCNPEQGADIRVYLPNAMGSALVPFAREGCSGMVSYLNVWAVNVAPGS